MANSNERSEREFQTDVSQAIANTEAEIFTDALDNEELENDADTSLEEMGEGLEGDDVEEEAEEESEEEDDEESAESEEEADDENQDEPEQRPQGDRQPQDRRHVPLREERQRRRAAEERAGKVETELAEMRGRFDEMSRRINAPAPRQEAKTEPKAKPDMFADPEGYEKWVLEQAEIKAESKFDQRFSAFEQRQQQERETRLNENLGLAANGERGIEFQAAYRALTSLDPRNAQNRATVQRLISSPDAGAAILDWFQDNGAEDFRESMARQLGLEYSSERRSGQRNGQRRQESRQSVQQPRHEYRLPQSLNGTQGGNRQSAPDPEMMDDTDGSVFRFATR